MSSLIYKQWKQYYQLPCLPPSVERGLSAAAFRYYAFLCEEMNRRSATEFHLSNADIAARICIKDPKTLAKARRELHAAKLVDCSGVVPPGVHVHIMLNEAGAPIPPREGRKGVVYHQTQTLSSKHRQITKAPEPVLSVRPKATSRCRIHGDSEHWSRDGHDVCEKCHPSPHRPPSDAKTLADVVLGPTAKELGFQ